MHTKNLVILMAFLLLMGGSARAIPAGSLIVTSGAIDPKSPTFEKDLKRLTKEGMVEG